MCLAVPGRVIEVCGDCARVDFNGNRSEVCVALTPEAVAGEWVLVHAGFAITRLDEREARQTWDYLSGMDPQEIREEIGAAEGRS